MSLLVVIFGLLVLGLAIAVAATRAERRRRSAVLLTTRLEALQPALSKDQPSLGFDPRRPLPVFLQRMLARADVDVRLDLVTAAGFILFVAGLGIAYAVNTLAGAAAFAAGTAAAVFLLHNVGVRRVAQFVESLPHFLDSIRQLLVAGYSFQQAFLRAAEDAPPAIRRYLDPAQRRIRNGDTTADALTWTAERIDNPELHMLATAVRTNARFGGAVGPILMELSKMLRNRARVARELRAATAETRMSGLVLTLLPPGGMIVVALLNLTYIQVLWETAPGRRMFAVAILLQLTGTFVMRRLMKLDF
jgi:tight adherence protein B